MEAQEKKPDVASKRQLGVLPNLYQAVFYYVLWVTFDII
jgi:hypothetical protein